MRKTLKRSLFVLLIASIILCYACASGNYGVFNNFTIKAIAASKGTCGENLTWALDDSGTLTISGTGDMNQYSSSTRAPWYSQRAKITSVVIDEGVTSVGAYAFYNCAKITSLVIPESITSIGDSAFQNCENITNINWNAESVNDFTSSSNAFEDAGTAGTGIELVFGDSVKSIPAHLSSIKHPQNYPYSLSYTPKIISVTIGNNVTSIGDSAFVGCANLTEITIPDSVTSIGSGAFDGCSGITSITIPNDVTSIGNHAFSNCKNLSKIYWNAVSVEDFEQLSYVFTGAGESVSGIEVVIGDSVESIPSNAFANITISSITMGNSVASIGAGAFGYCVSIATLNIKDIAAWCGIEFEDETSNPMYYAESVYLNGILIEGDLVIPDGVTRIGNYAFYHCDSLTSITIPEDVTSIGDSAFKYCRTLTSITIPGCVTSIGEYAFAFCDSLTSITMPDSLISVGAYAFQNNIGIVDVYISDISAWCYIDFENFSSNPMLYAENIYLDEILIECLDIPDGVTSIGDYAFEGYEGFTSITIPDSVTSIGSSAFDGCSGITSITIPIGVTSVGDYAFRDCTNLTTIWWNAENVADFSSSSEVFENAGTSGSGIHVSFGDSVKKIPANFSYVYISVNYDNGCHRPKIESVAIGENVTSIGQSALNTGLKYIFYNGSESEWENITIGSYNYGLDDAIVHYNSLNHFNCLGEWIVDENATCLTDGLKHQSCVVCGYIPYYTLIPALGHDFYSEWTIDKESTCTEIGSKSHHCSRCNEKSDVIVIDALGHEFSDEWTIDVEATCTEKGSKSHHCLRCDEKSDVTTVDVLGHNFSDWQTDIAENCTEAGLEYRICSVCDKRETNVVPAHGHLYPEKGNVITPPTTTEPGLQIKVCTVCKEHAIYEDIPVLETPTIKELDGQWVYASGNTIITDYTGLAEYCGNYYHIANGVLDWNYTGLSYYNGNWWYVTNGVIDWSYTGLTYYYDTWYYVTNGFLDWNVTTLTYFCDVWYYVENGQINWNSNTLCYYGDTWYYVKGGTVAWDYTGWVEYYGGWYYITNGWLDWSKQ